MPQCKIKGLVAALKASYSKVQVVRADFELHITKLQEKLQPETLPEVRAQSATLVKEASASIAAAVNK